MDMNRLLFGLLLPWLALTGCSDSEPSEIAAAVADKSTPMASHAPMPAATADVTVPGGPGKACNRLTARKMSAILGSAVAATPHDDTQGVTECSYSPVAATGPSVEFTVSSGDGGSTLRALAGMANHDPNAGKPYAGIGDQADVLGAAILIQDGDDLITFVLTGVEDEPAVARKMFDAAKAN